MKGGIKKHKKYLAAVIITVSVFLLLAFSYLFGKAFNFLELKTYDLRVRLLAPSTRPSDDIVVVLIDQASIDWAYQERGWSWPWPRKAYAELIDFMHAGGVNSLAFDVIFSEPSLYGEKDDEAFIRADRNFDRTVHTVFFATLSGRGSSWPEDLKSPVFNLAGFDPILPGYDLLNLLNAEDAKGRQVLAQFPIEGLTQAAGALGNITGKADEDGIFRRGWLFTFFDGKAVPGLSAASLLVSGSGTAISYDEKKRNIQWGNYTIPVDKNGASLLRFKGGGLDRYAPYWARDILKSAEAYATGKTAGMKEDEYLRPEELEGKYVFFGYYAPGLFDICSTPIESVYPGVGMHITMLDNILRQDFIREIPDWMELLISFAVIILIVFLVLFSSRIPLTIGGSAGLIVAVIVLGIGAYAKGYWIPIIAPMAGVVFAFLSSTLYSYATEGSQKRFIKSAFSQYLSPTVIEQLLANPERLTLGGERREISIFFSDVQGFTTISEKLDPAKLTELLNDYLSFMTDTILDSGGTIDKYEGDAIIAFWNAPLNFEDHAARALGASMLCQQKLAERQDFFFDKFGCRLLTRIGLNTGYAVVGNMGSGKRFDYTMLGDSVNLAARLEGLNKQFGTYLMCTETTFNQAVQAGPFFGRKLAQVAVVGKKEPVTVYEPIPEAVFREKEDIIRRFDEARDLFYTGEFAAALPRFEALADQDKPPFFYAEQCRYYLERPAEWKGFWQAMSK
jgi:adenylate cyclase